MTSPDPMNPALWPDAHERARTDPHLRKILRVAFRMRKATAAELRKIRAELAKRPLRGR